MTVIFILILILGIIGMCFVIDSQCRKNRELKLQVLQKDKVIENAAQNIKSLLNNQLAMETIRQNRTAISELVKGAGTDEEVNQIVADILSRNNSRVHDNQGNNSPDEVRTPSGTPAGNTESP